MLVTGGGGWRPAADGAKSRRRRRQKTGAEQGVPCGKTGLRGSTGHERAGQVALGRWADTAGVVGGRDDRKDVSLPASDAEEEGGCRAGGGAGRECESFEVLINLVKFV